MKEVRINIDDFNSNKQVLIYILNSIKAWNNKIIFYSFFVTYNKIVLVNRIIDLIDKLNKNDILLKFVWFPFCVFDNHNLIEKYFINYNYYNFREAIIKKWKCLRCYYYMFC